MATQIDEQLELDGAPLDVRNEEPCFDCVLQTKRVFPLLSKGLPTRESILRDVTEP